MATNNDFLAGLGGAAAGFATGGPVGAALGGAGGFATSGKLVDKIRSAARGSGLSPIKRRREMLLSDSEMLQNNPDALGLSQAQRRQLQSEADQASAASRQAQVTQIGQQALAGQGFQQGGFEQAQADIAAQSAGDSAKASADIARLSEQKANSEANRVRAAVDVAAEAEKADTRYWIGNTLNLVSQGIAAVSGI